MSLSKILKSYKGGSGISEATDIVNIINKHSVRIQCLIAVMIGLPNSGTSSLLEGLLDRSERINHRSGLDVYKAVLLKNSVSGESELKDVTDFEDAMLLLTLAKFFINHYEPLPSFANLSFSNIFQSTEVNEYFQTFCKKLFQFTNEVRSSKDLSISLSRSHGFLTFFDINVSKAVYEIVFILGGSCQNIVLFIMLNLFHYTCERIKSPIDLADSIYEGKYKGEELDLFKLHTALEYYVHTMEATFRSNRNCKSAILVGTHADEIKPASELDKRRDEIWRLIDDYSQEINIQGATAFEEIIPLSNAKDKCEELKKKFYELVDKQIHFEDDVPMKYMFLLCMLRSTTKKSFIPYSELVSLAMKIDFTEKDINGFLDLFCKSCFLFLLKTDSKQGLDSSEKYVVLRPADFIENLAWIYSKKSKDHELMSCGYLPTNLAESYWGKPSNDPSNLYNFYTKVLSCVGLMVEISPDRFFMPSIRSEYDTEKPTLQSNSLLTRYTISHLPFHKQCDLVKHFQNYHHENCKLELNDCPYYNVVKFSCISDGKEVATLSVRFRCDFLELSIFSSSKSTEIPIFVYSYIKTAWVTFLNEVSMTFPTFSHDGAFSYKLAVVCPKSQQDDIHLLKFDPRNTECLALRCESCQGAIIDCSSHPARLWIETACEPHKNITQPNDRLAPENIMKVIELLELNKVELKDVEQVAAELKQEPVTAHQQEGYKSLKDIVFSILYCWRQSDSKASMSQLAKVFMRCKLVNIAYHLDPSLLQETTEVSSDLTNTELIKIAAAWPNSPRELADVLELDTSSDLPSVEQILRMFLDGLSGDKRTILAGTLRKKEHYTMADIVNRHYQT